MAFAFHDVRDKLDDLYKRVIYNYLTFLNIPERQQPLVIKHLKKRHEFSTYFDKITSNATISKSDSHHPKLLAAKVKLAYNQEVVEGDILQWLSAPDLVSYRFNNEIYLILMVLFCSQKANPLLFDGIYVSYKHMPLLSLRNESASNDYTICFDIQDITTLRSDVNYVLRTSDFIEDCAKSESMTETIIRTPFVELFLFTILLSTSFIAFNSKM